MKVKLYNTLVYLEIENPTKLTERDIQLINETIEERKLTCAGCNGEFNENWIATIHRPKSAYNEETGSSKQDWSLWLFHQGNKDCIDKWLQIRKK